MIINTQHDKECAGEFEINLPLAMNPDKTLSATSGRTPNKNQTANH
jgi:hypothetical protein